MMINRNYALRRSLAAVVATLTLLLTNASLTLAQTTPPVRDAVVDFNGDGKTDFSILRSVLSPGAPFTWWTQINGGSGESSALTFGQRGLDQPVPADYDGDRKDDIAIFRFNGTGAGNWYILQSTTNTYRIEQFGQAGDNASVVDDYDGDGKDDLAVFRVNTAAQGAGPAYFFYRGSLNNPTGTVTYVPWGYRYGSQSEQVDDPYTGDFDGDGKADFGVQRIADQSQTSTNNPAVFYIKTATGNVLTQYFGWKSDRVVPGDYDGDGKTDIAVARGFNIGTNPPTPINWFIRYSSGRPDEYVNFGTGINFNFAQGDYDGDGATDIALYVASEGRFYWRPSSAPTTVQSHQWGASGDLPTAGYNNR